MDLLKFLGMNKKGVVAVGVVLVGALSTFMAMEQQKIMSTQYQSSGCHVPAIYNFGDSNSDTGGRSAAFTRIPPPYGITFFAEKLGLPSLNAHPDSIGTNFRHGANFANGGSTILALDSKMFEARCSIISLDVQLQQFLQLKARTTELCSQDKRSEIKSSLPRAEDFSKALYTLDIGQNDLYAALMFMTLDQVKASIPNIIFKLTSAIEQLYLSGARNFWIHNTGPIGCLPTSIIYNP